MCAKNIKMKTRTSEIVDFGHCRSLTVILRHTVVTQIRRPDETARAPTQLSG